MHEILTESVHRVASRVAVFSGVGAAAQEQVFPPAVTILTLAMEQFSTVLGVGEGLRVCLSSSSSRLQSDTTWDIARVDEGKPR